MSEPISVNRQIADLLQEQTYADRMEMARWFCEAMSDLTDPVTPVDIATLFEGWADGIIEDDEDGAHP